MADVDRWGDRTPRRDRGQLILVTALSLAILFVTLALILNTAIYTENLATRSGDIGGATDAVRYHDAAREATLGTFEYVHTYNNSSHDTLQTDFVAGVEAFRNQSARQFAMGDRAVETTVNTTVNGTHIAQSDESREFTNASGTAANWTLAEDVRNTRAVRFHVHRDLLDVLGGSPFRMILDDGTDTWELAVTRPGLGNDIEVSIDGPTGGGSCTETTADAWINVTNGTFAGGECAPLETFADGLSGPYEIRFENGTNARGTYTMVVDNATLAEDVDATANPHFDEPGTGQPFAGYAFYSVTVDVVYETPRLYYETTVRIAPEEADG